MWPHYNNTHRCRITMYTHARTHTHIKGVVLQKWNHVLHSYCQRMKYRRISRWGWFGSCLRAMMGRGGRPHCRLTQPEKMVRLYIFICSAVDISDEPTWLYSFIQTVMKEVNTKAAPWLRERDFTENQHTSKHLILLDSRCPHRDREGHPVLVSTCTPSPFISLFCP